MSAHVCACMLYVCTCLGLTVVVGVMRTQRKMPEAFPPGGPGFTASPTKALAAPATPKAEKESAEDAPEAAPVAEAARPVADPIKDGDTVPAVVFKCGIRDDSIGGENPFTWKDVSTGDLFKGKRVVIFALPGHLLDSRICIP